MHMRLQCCRLLATFRKLNKVGNTDYLTHSLHSSISTLFRFRIEWESKASFISSLETSLINEGYFVSSSLAINGWDFLATPFWWSFLWEYLQQFASMLGSQFFSSFLFENVWDLWSPLMHPEPIFWKWCDWLKGIFYWKLHSNKNLWTWKEKFLIYYLTPTPPFRGESDVMQLKKKEMN